MPVLDSGIVNRRSVGAVVLIRVLSPVEASLVALVLSLAPALGAVFLAGESGVEKYVIANKQHRDKNTAVYVINVFEISTISWQIVLIVNSLADTASSSPNDIEDRSARINIRKKPIQIPSIPRAPENILVYWLI